MLRPATGLAVLAAFAAGAGLAAQDAVVAPFFGVHTHGHAVTGGALGVPLSGTEGPLALVLSAGVDATNDWVEPDQWEYWEVNADLVLYGGDIGQGGVFLLAGFNLANVYEDDAGFFPPGPRSERTSVAGNLGAGFAFVVRSVMPVLGAKVEIGKMTPFLIFLGLGIPLGDS